MSGRYSRGFGALDIDECEEYWERVEQREQLQTRQKKASKEMRENIHRNPAKRRGTPALQRQATRR